MKSLLLVLGLWGCGPATNDSGPQTPPVIRSTAMEAWIAQGLYKAWACEPAPPSAA